MERLYVFIWRLFLPREEIEKRQKLLTSRRLEYFIRHTSPGGILPFTFLEKLKIAGLILLLMSLSLLVYLALATVRLQ